ncbi:MAG: hypothetical protein IPK83_17740 [Planctomycetes bacterium]|nr:hypothetical protein [Planctomycetota bacterium]
MKLIGKLFLCVLLLGLLYPGAFLAYISTVTIYEELVLWNDLRPARQWPIVPIDVIDAKLVPISEKHLPVIPELHCVFAYSIDGRPHTIDYSKFSGHYSIMSPNRGGLLARLTPRTFQKERPRAHVNPENASQAVPVDAIDDAALGVELAGASFAFVLGMVILSLAIVPTFMLLRSNFVKDDLTAARAEEAKILKAHSDLKWMWFGLLMLVGPGFMLMVVFTVPALIRGGAERSYWVPVGIGFFFALLFFWLWRRNVRWWKTAGQSRIELMPFPITLQSPPRGRLILAPTSDSPETLQVRYTLFRRVSSKHVHTVFKADVILQRSGYSGDTGVAWYAMDFAPQNVPDIRHLVTPYQTVSWNLRVRGRANGRKFSVSFLRAVG